MMFIIFIIYNFSKTNNNACAVTYGFTLLLYNLRMKSRPTRTLIKIKLATQQRYIKTVWRCFYSMPVFVFNRFQVENGLIISHIKNRIPLYRTGVRNILVSWKTLKTQNSHRINKFVVLFVYKTHFFVNLFFFWLVDLT